MAGSNFFSPVSSTADVALVDSTVTAANEGLAYLAKCTGTPPTTANLYAHGCTIVQMDSGTGVGAVYQNIGTSASPSWTLQSVAAAVSNFIATETGANNAIAGALPGVTLVPGLMVVIQLAHTLQAGANTFNLNGGGALAIKSHSNVATDIGTAYAATGIIDLVYNGTLWLDMSK